MSTSVQLPQTSFQVTKNQDIFKFEEAQANKNKLIKKIGRVVYLIFSIIVFPVGLGRLFVEAVKQLAPTAILPATQTFNLKEAIRNQHRTDKKGNQARLLIQLSDHRERFLANPKNRATQVTLETADHALLDGVAIESKKQEDTSVEEEKWIVFLHANEMCTEEALEYLKEISNSTGANVLSANYRGVMRSEGKIKGSQDLVMDGEAMVQYLLQNGVAPENILVHGWSLGGAVAAEVAALHQEEGHEMHLCHDRSLSSIKAFLGARMNKLFAWVVGGLVRHMGWKFDGLKAYEKIQGHKFLIYSKKDETIRYSGSLYKCLKESQKTKKDRSLKKERVKLKKEGKPIPTHSTAYKPNPTIEIDRGVDTPHGIPLNRLECMAHYVDQVRAALQIA